MSFVWLGPLIWKAALPAGSGLGPWPVSSVASAMATRLIQVNAPACALVAGFADVTTRNHLGLVADRAQRERGSHLWAREEMSAYPTGHAGSVAGVPAVDRPSPSL
ncbi:hypothetical protein EEI76_19215 [Enterobacter cloacae]|nr:hypothetical protein EEI76_19215 [Enterobacter cloacae]